MTSDSPRTAVPTAVVLLAAGKGVRMASKHPKVLHRVAGQPMLHFAMRAAMSLAPERMVVVTGPAADAVSDCARELHPNVEICVQNEQRGTGDAVLAAVEALDGFEGRLVVLFADTPFVRAETLSRLATSEDVPKDALAVLGFETPEPDGYGRLVIEGGQLLRIVEAKDATPEERALTTCSSGAMAGPAQTMFRLLRRVSPDNAQGEYYLTDIVALARDEGVPVRAVFCDIAETLGVNDRRGLAVAEAAFQASARARALVGGATLIAPETVYFSWDTALGRDVLIEPGVVFGPGVEIADNVTVRAFCHIAGTRIASGASVGPFARLRDGVEINENARVGNFVEMKKVTFGPGAKAGHLTYVGDASVGAEANLGAGVVTCNFDGVSKHRTEIGRGAFIGTNTALVAPITVGDDAYTATGSVITKDVPPGDLGIARGRQTNKAGRSHQIRKRLGERLANGKTGGK